MPDITNPLHRDEPEGTDEQGRLHGSSAVQRLLNDTPTGPDWNNGLPVSFWETADAVVEHASQETKDAALRRLLALHMFDLTQDRPMVAVRNIQVGDVIELFGVPRRVTAVRRTTLGQAGWLTTVPERGAGKTAGCSYDADIRVPLRHRVSLTQAAALFEKIVEHSMTTPGESHHNGYRDGMVAAYAALAGIDEMDVFEQIEQALQARHDEQIAAENG